MSVLADQITQIRREIEIKGVFARFTFDDVDPAAAFFSEFLEKGEVETFRILSHTDIEFEFLIVLKKVRPGRTDIFTVYQISGYF